MNNNFLDNIIETEKKASSIIEKTEKESILAEESARTKQQHEVENHRRSLFESKKESDLKNLKKELTEQINDIKNSGESELKKEISKAEANKKKAIDILVSSI